MDSTREGLIRPRNRCVLYVSATYTRVYTVVDKLDRIKLPTSFHYQDREMVRLENYVKKVILYKCRVTFKLPKKCKFEVNHKI